VWFAVIVATLGVVAVPVAGPAAAQTGGQPAQTVQATQPAVTPPPGQPSTTPAAPPPAAEEKGPNQGRISLSVGVDWTTDYYFRGIRQETTDWIFQPYGELTFKLYEGPGPLSGVFLTLGTWNSFHGGPTGDSGPNASPQAWYELDFYTKLGVTLFEDVTAAFVYTVYTSPNDLFKTVQELALSLSYNDAKVLGPFALNPNMQLAFEVSGQADAGSSKGVYLQLGVAPGLALFEKAAYPVALSFPLTLGLSLSDYYEFGTGDDDTFGYFSAGATAAVPLKFIPAALGTWQAKAGVTFLVLGDNNKRVNLGDRYEVIGTLGLALTY
jgi:hypothetical protein